MTDDKYEPTLFLELLGNHNQRLDEITLALRLFQTRIIELENKQFENINKKLVEWMENTENSFLALTTIIKISEKRIKTLEDFVIDFVETQHKGNH